MVGDKVEQLWTTIGQFEDSQTSIVTTLILVVGGGLGVLFGSWLFGGRVKDLQTALDQSKALVEKHSRETQEKLGEMNDQLASTMALLGQLRGAVSDIQTDAAVVEDANAAPADHQRNTRRAALKEYWYPIRDELWRKANDPKIHGKTRTRYSNFGNNDLDGLINAMRADDNLDERTSRLFLDAFNLWTLHRNGRAPLTDQGVQQMRELKIQLVPG
jgi:hypothetical protein